MQSEVFVPAALFWIILRFILLFAFSFALVRVTEKPGRRIIHQLTRLARHRKFTVAAVGLLAALIGMTISLLKPPVPSIHDEFGYLLAADTYSHGRMTNPTHSMWEHFESFHILQRPTYASKYPPAQGMILAIGQRIGGHPQVGLWISNGLAAAAVCWMLQGCLPGRWALLGGLLVAFNGMLQLRWGQTYWGGYIALAGGAILLGSYFRLIRQPHWHTAILMGLGLLVLANSRPYEGLVISLPVAFALLTWAVVQRPPVKTLVLQVILPTGCVLAIGAAAMIDYNLKVTGRPLTLPYQVHETTYAVIPLFLWQSPKPEPSYLHSVMRAFHVAWAADLFNPQQTASGFLRIKGHQILRLWEYFLHISLTIPILILPWTMQRRGIRLAATVVVAGLLALIGAAWIHPHYFAPAVAALPLLVVQGLRQLRQWSWHGLPMGRMLVSSLVVAQLVMCLLLISLYLIRPSQGFGQQRASFLRQLEQRPGKHLVIVRYGRQHIVHEEWVFNAADIDGAKVVWAREMGPAENARLLAYFKDRRVWLLMPDASPPKLIAYPGTKAPAKHQTDNTRPQSSPSTR